MLRHLPTKTGDHFEKPRPWLCDGFYQVTFRDEDLGCLLKDLTDWWEQEKGNVEEVSSGVLDRSDNEFVFTLYVVESSESRDG